MTRDETRAHYATHSLAEDLIMAKLIITLAYAALLAAFGQAAVDSFTLAQDRVAARVATAR